MKRIVDVAKMYANILTADDSLILANCVPRATKYLEGKPLPPRTRECFTAAVAILLRLPQSPDIDYLLLHLNRFRRGLKDTAAPKGMGPTDITLGVYIRSLSTTTLLAEVRDEVSLHPKVFNKDSPYYYVASYTAGACLHWENISPIVDWHFVCMLAALNQQVTDEFDGEFLSARIAYALHTTGAGVEKPTESEIWEGAAMSLSLCWAEMGAEGGSR